MKKSVWIMDCSVREVKNICFHFMKKFDNYQQVASDKRRPDLMHHFVEAHNLLDDYYHVINNKTGNISEEIRTEIRSTIKFTERLYASELLLTRQLARQ